MQRFSWLGYETQLLEQLQRQQNSTQFCDTMLQSDGISVPAHSCVLAALSPYLSQRLSASPSPQSGQKRWLHLQAVSAQTLVKLVRLLYSGELEVRSSEEQNEVLAAAHKFGITNIKLGCKDSEGEGTELLGVRQKVHIRGMHKDVKMQDPKVQAEISGKIEDDPLERKSFASIGTQTVESILMSAVDPGPAPASPPTVESASVVGSCSTCQSKNVFQSSLTSNPSVHCDPEVSAQRGSASFRHMETIATCFSQHADSPRSQKKNQPAEEDQERPGQQDGNRKATVDGGEKTLKKEHKKKSHFITGGKNLEKMKWKRESMETAKISIKVKLRRRTRGDVWETVAVQDEDVSVLSNLNQNTPQTGLDVLQTPAPSALPVQYPDSQKVRDVSNSSPEQANTSSFSEARSTCSLWMDHSSELEPECLLPPQSPGEESNEQIDEMLESIMRSLNYLPNLNTNCKKSQVDLGAASTLHEVPATENDVGPTAQSADVAAAEGVSYQTLETPGDQSDTDTGIHHFAAQNQQILAGPSPVPTDLQTWQQQLPQMSSSVLLSGPMKSPFPQTSGFPLPVTCFSIGENLDRLLLQQPSFHEDQSVQVLPPPVATKFPPPCTDELRLPRCLSPLKPSPCESPSGNALPWLKGSACTLQLPLNNIAARDDARQSGDRESERIKMRKTDEHDDVEDAPPPKKRKGRCPNSQKEPKVPALDLISSRGRNAAKSLHSVFLYCPAVPMKEREKTNSSLSPGSATLVTAPRGAKSRGAPNLGTENARIKTRGFVKTCEQNSSSTVTDRCCVLIPLISRAVMVPKQDPPPKRGRGRPRKIKLEKETTDAAGAEIRVQKEARGKASEKQTTTEERKTCRRLISTVGNRDTEKQRKSDKCPGKTETDNVGSSQTLKPSLMKTLKELRKCIKWKPSKTRKGKEAPGGKGSKAVDLEKAKVREAEDGFNMRAEMEKDREAKFQHQTLYDNNHNLLPNTSKDECKPAGPDGLETWRSTATLPGNRDQSARSSHQGDYGSSTLSCFDEEENEDDEVDVLLYSPEKGSPTTEVEERVVVLPDEDEEEEDVIEIDVTGDEE